MACGRPVIAYASGGAKETVIEGKTGKFFFEQTWESLSEAIVKFDAYNFNPQEIKEHVQKFSKPRFKKEIKNFVQNHLVKLQ